MAQAEKSKVCGVLLAAGASSRFGGDNKLLAEIDGVPLIRRVAERLGRSRLAQVTAVTGFEADRVEQALARLDVRVVHNPRFQDGMASSLKCGIEAVDDEVPAAMIVLGDMPGVTPELVDRLLAAFESEGGSKITFPVGADGRQGNPVIWPRRYFADISSLTGDKGAKGLIAANPDAVLAVPVDDPGMLSDVDSRSDLSRLKGDGTV